MGQSSSGIQDRYFLQKVRLGTGAFGTVWRAVDRRTGAAVAMKHMEKSQMRRQGLRQEDVEREIAMMKACAHENIIQLFDTFEDAQNVYLAQEYCDGGDFGDKLKERGLSVRESDAAEWMRHICRAIAALHARQICHRDIKPDNFLVSFGGDDAGRDACGTLKLADFGLAVFLPKGQLLKEKCGTPCYMAPELHLMPKRSRGYSFPADAWAAGVSLYQMLFGNVHPFLDDQGRMKEQELLRASLDYRAATCSEEAQRLCRALVEVDPARRLTAASVLRTPWLSCRRATTVGAGLPCSVVTRPPRSPRPSPRQHAAAPSGTFLPPQRREQSPMSMRPAPSAGSRQPRASRANTAPDVASLAEPMGRRSPPRRAATDGDLIWLPRPPLDMATLMSSATQLLDTSAEYTVAAAEAWSFLNCAGSPKAAKGKMRRSSVPPPSIRGEAAQAQPSRRASLLAPSSQLRRPVLAPADTVTVGSPKRI